MVNFVHRLLSRFHPVVIENNAHVVVVIRGHIFEGDSWEEVCRRIADECKAARAELRERMGDVTREAFAAANPHGRIGPARSLMASRLAAVEAYEAFLRGRCGHE